MACQNLPTAVAPQPTLKGIRSWEFRVPLASLWPAMSRDDGQLQLLGVLCRLAVALCF